MPEHMMVPAADAVRPSLRFKVANMAPMYIRRGQGASACKPWARFLFSVLPTRHRGPNATAAIQRRSTWASPCSAARRSVYRRMADRLLIVDFGSQVTQLIARRLRE